MGLLRWLTQNHADTEEPTHRDLGPIKLANRRGEALLLISYQMGRMPRWRVESTDGKIYTMRAARKRRFWWGADTVTLRLISQKGETWLHASSRGRGIIGDLGRNRRNIIELFRALRRAGLAAKVKK